MSADAVLETRKLCEMPESIPSNTILALARTICLEARNYGFQQIDIVKLINAILDTSASDFSAQVEPRSYTKTLVGGMDVSTFPLSSKRLHIRQADPVDDLPLLRRWMQDRYGRHFLLSCSTAQKLELEPMLTNPSNAVGILSLIDGMPIGAVAYLDIDKGQRRAELRKLIGEKSARGRGLAEEATRLWILYGGEQLGLEKIYVSTLQTHLRNIELNESIGFQVEGLLKREVLVEGERRDVLRMGLCFDEFCAVEDLEPGR
jgi:RimJ/RimL family protein N-acetyltransferase